MNQTQNWIVMPCGAKRIRQAARTKPKEKLTALLHHIAPETLELAYQALKREAAPGVDGVTWKGYGEGRAERLHDLQRAMVDNILTPIYETEFIGFSYGFRPGRGAHDALDALAYGIDRRKINWIVDADVRQYFDRISRDWLVQLLEVRIGDRRVLRLLKKWLRAGVMEEGKKQIDTGQGTPQGAVVSPVLANVHLHYILDPWYAKKWRPQEARGDAIMVRYADDFVLGFQYRSEAERFLRDLKARFAKFGLALHPEKTRLLEFGRYAAARRQRRGQGRPETFDFLGFTHYCGRTRAGRFKLGRKPIAKRMRRKLQEVKSKLRRRMHADRIRDRTLAGASAPRLAEVLCRSVQLPLPEDLHVPTQAALAEDTPTELAERPHFVGQAGRPMRQAMAESAHPPPVARATFCR